MNVTINNASSEKEIVTADLYYRTWLFKQYENGRESDTCCIYGCMSLAVHTRFEDCGEKQKWLYYCPKHWRKACKAAEAEGERDE